MAVLTYGPGEMVTGDNASGFAIGNLAFLVLTTETPTLAIGNYERLGLPNTIDTFHGYGFTYDSFGNPTGGTVTQYTETNQNDLVADLSGISVPVSTLVSWAAADQQDAASTIFSGSDTITGATGSNLLYGYDGDDTFYTGNSTSEIFGGNGTDTVVLPDAFRQNRIFQMGSTIVQGPHLNDTLYSVERIQFIDGTMYYDSTSPAADVTRLYQAALGRAPDPLGLAYWVSTLNGGASLHDLAASFISSSEFQSRFPGAQQDPTAFVNQLYQNILGRQPDPSGLAFWTGLLTNGQGDAATVLAGIAESAENVSATQSLISGGIWVANEQAAQVARLYDTTLGRAPDATGLAFWTGQLESGAKTLQQEAQSFVGSAEFQGKYGSLNDQSFVDQLYRNVLGRNADSSGEAFWTQQLASGAMTRAGVTVGFSESQEHQANLVPKIEASGIVLAS